SVDHAENVFLSAGFAIARKDVIRSEWREHEIEAGDTDQILRDLLTVARLERERDDLVDRYGAALYELLRAGAIWRPYQMLGKLLPIAYLLGRLLSTLERWLALLAEGGDPFLGILRDEDPRDRLALKRQSQVERRRISERRHHFCPADGLG